jgi:hypothetical protein
VVGCALELALAVALQGLETLRRRLINDWIREVKSNEQQQRKKRAAVRTPV